jgi:hypothetical protein
MNSDMLEETTAGRKGAILRLFGVILIILGGLDSMLSWRGGFAVSSFYVLLIGLGIFLFVLGAIRGRKDSR